MSARFQGCRLSFVSWELIRCHAEPSGIGAEAIARPEGRVPYHALVTLLQEVAGETACPHLGLLAGRMWYLADLGCGWRCRAAFTNGRRCPAVVGRASAP